MKKRKPFEPLEKFIVCHYKFSISVVSLMFMIGSIASVYSDFVAPVSMVFVFSLASVLRLIIYKTGKIPCIMIDKTWEKYRLKHLEEHIVDKYKKMCIKRAAIYSTIAIVFMIIWIVCELVACFV